MTVRLLQLSDCHLQPEPGTLYREIDPEQNLLTMLQAARAWRPDVLVLSGDLAEQPAASVYRRLNTHAAALGCPVMAFPGNHDDPELMQRHLCAGVFEHSNPLQLEHWQLAWIDTVVPGEPHGELTPEKLSCLARLCPETPALLFMHHQPMAVGTPWIDRFDCRNPEVLWDWLGSREHSIRAIGFGHIHHSWQKTLQLGQHSLTLYGAPATSVCVLPGSSEFRPDPRGPAGRWYLLDDHGSLRSGLLGC